jgi:hypothetical protein
MICGIYIAINTIISTFGNLYIHDQQSFAIFVVIAISAIGEEVFKIISILLIHRRHKWNLTSIGSMLCITFAMLELYTSGHGYYHVTNDYFVLLTVEFVVRFYAHFILTMSAIYCIISSINYLVIVPLLLHAALNWIGYLISSMSTQTNISDILIYFGCVLGLILIWDVVFGKSIRHGTFLFSRFLLKEQWQKF